MRSGDYRIEVCLAGPDPRVALRARAPTAHELEAVRAADLAQSLRQEKRRFKLDVRKLKELGLTESLPVGYRLSPRGHAVLRAELAERRERRAAHTGD
jgi:hypothetical protein